MANEKRTTRTFSVEKELLREVERTRGSVSASERVNQLLKAGLDAERRESLHTEASRFFAAESADDSKARRAFRSASIKSITRE